MLVFVFLVTTLYAVIEGSQISWAAPRIICLFTVSVASALIFVVYESRHPEPLLDLRFFRSVPFATATVLGLSVFASFGGFLFFLNALCLEQVRGFSAFKTGVSTLPLAAAMSFSSPVAGRLMGRHGTRWPLLIAGGGLLASVLMLTQRSDHTSITTLLLAYTFFGVGLGMSNPAIANNAVAGMPLSLAGVAAASASMSRQVGASLGVAVAGTVVATSRSHSTDFPHATHTVWWLVSAASIVVLLSSWLSNTQWAYRSTRQVLSLLTVENH